MATEEGLVNPRIVALKTREQEIIAELEAANLNYGLARDKANNAFFQKIKSSTPETAAALRDATRERVGFEEEIDALRAELETVRAEFDDALIEIAGNKPIKKVQYNDGKVEIFFDGVDDECDGLCHAHIVVEKGGDYGYIRNQFDSHSNPTYDSKDLPPLKTRKAKRSRAQKSKPEILYPSPI
ncbi:hypothetical protein IJ380_01480 [Candidatus Saccharibacteria bacterium]|nr:hypothetical protein [Candidatus Saccharibacteria bacterium]